MKNACKVIAMTAGLALLIPGTAEAGHVDHVVLVSDNSFSPDSVDTRVVGNPNEAVEWRGDTPPPTNEHNVRELHGIFSSGPPTLWASKSFTLNFSAGKFDYQCEVHGPAMSGVVNVRPLLLDTTPDGPPVQWASDGTTTGSAFDVQFRVGSNGDWRRWLTDTEKFKAVFGKNDRPVNFNPNRTYFVRVRSQKRVDTPNAHSRYFKVLLD